MDIRKKHDLAGKGFKTFPAAYFIIMYKINNLHYVIEIDKKQY